MPRFWLHIRFRDRKGRIRSLTRFGTTIDGLLPILIGICRDRQVVYVNLKG